MEWERVKTPRGAVLVVFDGSSIYAIKEAEPDKPDRKKGNGHPEEPIFIEKPGGNFFLKFPGKNWVNIKNLSADDSFLVDIIHLAGGMPPAPPKEPPGNGGDGNGDEEDPPFNFGDLVVSVSRPDLGVLFVMDVKKQPNPDGSKYWRVETVVKKEPMIGNPPYTEYSAAASDFERVIIE